MRATRAQYYDPDQITTPAGQPDGDRMASTATAIRARYANDPLLRAYIVKLFADGVLEGNPYAVPSTRPEVVAIRPYLQPILEAGKDGRLAVVGYIDAGTPLCADVRARHGQYESAAAVKAFLQDHGYHREHCRISSGQLPHERDVIVEYVKRFHLAGCGMHIHAIGDLPIRTAVDAIEAARAADGVATTRDAIAHLQLVHPDDVVRIGADRLYLAFTYSWAFAEPEYDLSVVPFFDHGWGGDDAALHRADGCYDLNAYPVRALRDAGVPLIAGSDAPVNTRDPQPFTNMAVAVTRRLPGGSSPDVGQSVPIRDVLDAYTINGARYLGRDAVAG